MGRYSNHVDQGERLRHLLEMTPSGPSGPTVRTPKRTCHRTGPDVVAQIIEGYERGVAVAQLAAGLQINQWTVGRYARLHRLPRRSPRLGPRQIEEAVSLYNEGNSLATLVKRCGVATDTVGKALRGAGVSLRPRRGWPTSS